MTAGRTRTVIWRGRVQVPCSGAVSRCRVQVPCPGVVSRCRVQVPCPGETLVSDYNFSRKGRNFRHTRIDEPIRWYHERRTNSLPTHHEIHQKTFVTREGMAKKRSNFVSKILHVAVCLTSVYGQYPKDHHTSYGSPFAVPSSGSSSFLSPIGASSLSSVLTAMGLTASTPPTPTQVSRSFSVNSQPSSLFFRNNSPGNPKRRQSPSQDPISGPAIDPFLRSSVGSPQISNALPSRMEPPPARQQGRNPSPQRVSLNPNSISLLNNLVTDILNPSVSSQLSTSAGQMPFIVLLPDTSTPGNQATGLIMSPNQNIATLSGQSIAGNSAITDLITLLRASGVTGDPQLTTQPGAAETPQIITIPSQGANSVVSSLANIPNDTPVLVLLDPGSFPGDTGPISPTSQTAARTSASSASNLNNVNALDLLTALAQSFPSTSTNSGLRGSGLGSLNRQESTNIRNLPPFPGTRGTSSSGTTSGRATGTDSVSFNPSRPRGMSSSAASAPPSSPATRTGVGAAHSSPASPSGGIEGGSTTGSTNSAIETRNSATDTSNTAMDTGNTATTTGNSATATENSATSARNSATEIGKPPTVSGNSVTNTGNSATGTGNSAPGSEPSTGASPVRSSAPPRPTSTAPAEGTVGGGASRSRTSQASSPGSLGGPSFQGDMKGRASGPGTSTGTDRKSVSSSTPPRNTMQMIIPVLDRGAGGGIYMYSFTIESPDGVTRHETGEVAPGLRKISRTLAPASVPGEVGTTADRANGRGGTGTGTVTQSNGAVTSSAAAPAVGNVAELGNLAGNYSYTAPDGKVLRVQYTHGSPTFVPRSPPQLGSPTALHPFDFLLSRLSDLRVHHQLAAAGGTVPAMAAGAPPVDVPPADAPPADAHPADAPPADAPPADGPPADGPPADGPPADGPPADGPPADGPPAEAMPAAADPPAAA
ncbi:hypothetical protein FHG87_009959 [Trinorchestia longiramus]|nr:hypothetical protein FHG87_009959 [Trinorchestia longiramus]